MKVRYILKICFNDPAYRKTILLRYWKNCPKTG